MLSPLGLKLYVRRANSGRDHRNLMYIIKNAYACNAHIKPYLPEHPVATRGLCGATPPPRGKEEKRSSCCLPQLGLLLQQPLLVIYDL